MASILVRFSFIFTREVVISVEYFKPFYEIIKGQSLSGSGFTSTHCG